VPVAVTMSIMLLGSYITNVREEPALSVLRTVKVTESSKIICKN
jgi:hypothetical protein